MTRVTLVALMSGLLACSLAAFAADIGAEVRALTGAHTRIVWIQDAGAQSDPLGERNTLHLMGLDSDDHQGAHIITPTIGSYQKPLMTDDGARIVFRNVDDHKIYVINWDGTGLRAVVDSAALEDVWRDPTTAIDWVYANITEQRGDKTIPVIRRYNLDAPETSEIVWDKMPAKSWQISSDGKAASGGAGNGNGLFTLPNGTYTQMYGGCWPSMSPDDSHLMWVFRGHHKGVHFYIEGAKPNQRVSYPVEFLDAPGVPSSHEMYHPRWSNNTRVFTITGPYWYKDWHWSDVYKLSNEAAQKVELYLGKFNAQLDGVERWVKVTDNLVGDFLGDAWVDPKEASNEESHKVVAKLLADQQTGQVANWPGETTGMDFIWEDKVKTNQIVDAKTGAIHLCTVEPRDRALYGRYQVMDTTGGAFLATDEREAAMLAACKQSNALTLEALVTPTRLDTTGVIMSFSSGKNSRDFTLLQVNDQLVLRLRTSATTDNGVDFAFGKLVAGKPQHVLVSYAPGKLYCFVNGGQAQGTDKVQGDFRNWTPQHLIFGDEWDGGMNWSGTIEGVTIYHRAMGIVEARAHYTAYTQRLQTRTPAARLTVQAKLVSTTTAPTPASIAPYRRCLSVNIYEVEKVIEGEYTGQQLMVAQWSVLDAKVQPAFLNFQKGQSYTLELEKYSDHPELESERMVFDMEEPDLPMYYAPVR